MNNTLTTEGNETMRQDIIDSINNMDKDAFIDVAVTFDMISKDDVVIYMETGHVPKKATKTYIKKRALTDEVIAEYVLLF